MPTVGGVFFFTLCLFHTHPAADFFFLSLNFFLVTSTRFLGRWVLREPTSIIEVKIAGEVAPPSVSSDGGSLRLIVPQRVGEIDLSQYVSALPPVRHRVAPSASVPSSPM